MSLKSLVAAAFAGACFSLPAVFADDAEGVARVPKPAPARLDASAQKATSVKAAKFTMNAPIKETTPVGNPHVPAIHGSPNLEPIPVGYGANGGCADGRCGGHGGGVRFSSPIELWLYGDDQSCTYPPDYGWSRPVKRPVLNRVPVAYYWMDPQHWVGDPMAFQGAPYFPTVYMPTDTTQLGYTYQRTWQWQPNPNMIPAPPWPSTWHRRECPEYTAQQRAGMAAHYGYGAGPGYVAAPSHGGYEVVHPQYPAAPARNAVPSQQAPPPKELPPGEKVTPPAPPAPDAK